MTQITALTDYPNQTMTLVLPDGSQVSFSLQYIANQKGWFYSFSYGSFANNNRRLVASPNMIRQFKNILPFGLACMLTDAFEPIYVDDFSTGRAKLYLLNQNDVAQVEALISSLGTNE